jgi:hypothetical protein
MLRMAAPPRGSRGVHGYSGFDDNYIGECEYSLRIARCRHRGARVVQCKAIVAPLDREPVRKWWTASVTMRRDGVLVYRIKFVGRDKPESSVVRR